MFSVLICDDSMVARKQAAKCLPENWSVAVHFAKDGEEAIAALQEGKGDLLLLDLNMPVMDGYQTLNAIRKQQLNTVVIVVSGDVQPAARERVQALGAIEFIKKPINAKVLKAVLAKNQLLPSEVCAGRELSLEDDQLEAELRDCYQEITNIAMGQAGDHLARFFNVFVRLPIPNVNLIEVAELNMMLQDIETKEQVSGICQGFIGPGVCGEALFILTDSSFEDVAQILGVTGEVDDQMQLELLMDAANILIGACLSGLASQLDLHFSQGHPVVLGQHRNIAELISENKVRWSRTLAIEISYGLEGYDAQCDLVLLLTEESMKVMNYKLLHLLED